MHPFWLKTVSLIIKGDEERLYRNIALKGDPNVNDVNPKRGDASYPERPVRRASTDVSFARATDPFYQLPKLSPELSGLPRSR